MRLTGQPKRAWHHGAWLVRPRQSAHVNQLVGWIPESARALLMVLIFPFRTRDQ